MLAIRHNLILVACVALACAPTGYGQQTTGAAANPPGAGRVDAYGDPLPAGALARLGTVRFRSGDYISAVALAPDGKTLAVAEQRQVIRFLDAATGKELRRLRVDHQGAETLAFSPDGRKLVCAGHSGPIQVFDTTTDKKIGQFGEQNNRATALVFSGDGNVLTVGNDNFGQRNLVPVWDVATGKRLTQVEP